MRDEKTLSSAALKRAQARKKLRVAPLCDLWVSLDSMRFGMQEATQMVLAANRLADMFPKA